MLKKEFKMAYFPMFIDFNQKRILVVGGGNIATEKLEKLVDFTKEITIIAKEVSAECHLLIKHHCLTLYNRAYKEGDIDGFDIIIVATDDIKIQESIYKESRGKNILVNSVDNTKFCDFIFPSYIKRGDLTIAFSTSGASPAFAKHLRRYFENLIPDGVENFLDKIKNLRKELPKGRKRMQYFERLVSDYFKKEFKN